MSNNRQINPTEVNSAQENSVQENNATRWALQVEYDGSAFHGWQVQDNAHSVQAEVEKALSKIAGHDVKTICAGRTDKGVHASAQVVHFDCANERQAKAWIKGGNAWASKAISFLNAWQVDSDFNARFSATARTYCYVIYNHQTAPTNMRHYATWHYRALDAQKMHEAAQYLVGENDFTSFRASRCQASSPNRNMHHIKVKRQGDFIYVELKANAFLYHMVRNIMGVLLAIGEGRFPAEFAQQILQAKDRSQSLATAPAYGLYLVDIDYPEKYPIKATRNIVPGFVAF